MNTTNNVLYKVNRLSRGYVFTYSDINSDVNKKEATIKALNRLVEKGKIKKLSKGKYYKPEDTVFGELVPSQKEVVKDLLEEDGRLIGYLTGYSIYNQMGLTTQVSNTLQIGKNEIRPSLKRGPYVVKFLKQKNSISEKNIPLLQILDCIRTIKKIPDTNIATSCKRIAALIEERIPEEVEAMIRLARKYPPFTRALLGSILDYIDSEADTAPLRKSLNPITTYTLPGASEALGKQVKNWNIEL
ncbi:MAG: DUF6088 family protein [Bacteroidales bacterium]|nr:DUF6088 family protein [Bacteroidales bacterium]